MDLALNNLQRLICHKNKTTNQRISQNLFLAFSPSVPIINHFRQVFKTAPCICTGLILINSCWSVKTDMFMGKGPQSNVTYVFVLVSLAVSCNSCSSCMVLEMGGKWPYCNCFVGCCFQDLFKISHSILV